MFVCFAFAKATQAQSSDKSSKKYKIQTVAFYNLENLFDIENDPAIYDEASPMMEMAEELRPDVYQKNYQTWLEYLGK